MPQKQVRAHLKIDDSLLDIGYSGGVFNGDDEEDTGGKVGRISVGLNIQYPTRNHQGARGATANALGLMPDTGEKKDMSEKRLYTIGFTKKTAEEFFTALTGAGVHRVVDIRLNRMSQLAGFAKARDLPFLLDSVAGIGYLHCPELAPTKDILDAFKNSDSSWQEYDDAYRALLIERRVEDVLTDRIRDGDCLLCSEGSPEHCHRRLATEYLKEKWGDVEICHL